MAAGCIGPHRFAWSDEGVFTVTRDAPVEGWTTLAFSKNDTRKVMVLPSEQFNRAAGLL